MTESNPKPVEGALREAVNRIGHHQVSSRWKGVDDPSMDDICEACGQTYGRHGGFACLDTPCKKDCPRCALEAALSAAAEAKEQDEKIK